MFELYCFDISSISIALVVLFTILLRKMTKSRENRTFILLISAVIFTGVFDMVSTMFNTSPDRVNSFASYFAVGMYFVLLELSYYLYCIYVLDITGTRHMISNTMLKYVMIFPFVLSSFCAITAHVTHFGYYFDETSTYIRMNSIIIYYICGGFYCLFSMIVILKNLEYIGYGKAVSLCSCSVFSLVASFIQFKYPYMLIGVLGLTLSLLFTMLFVTNPEEKMELKSQLLNYDSYLKDTKRAIDTKRPLTILMINVTNYSGIEKVMSYDGVVELLRRIATKLEDLNEMRGLSSDLYYLNNGQFRIVMDYKSSELLRESVEELYVMFNSAYIIGGLDISLESNICVADYPEDFSKHEELVNFGSLYIKEAKHSGILYASELLEQRKYDIVSRLDAILENAIANNRFDVYYQPIYSVRQKKFSHAEALVRLIDEQYGLVLPEVFISGAEENGTIYKIGRIVLEEVCKFVSSDEFKSLNIEKISMNVSPIQFMQRDFADEVISTLQRYSVRLDQIILEIRESDAYENQNVILENIDMLSRAGIEISIDDFGSGYTNIETVSRMPAKAVKLDRRFIASDSNEKYKVVIENSIQLMKKLGKVIVVEGVETKEFLDRYIDLGGDYIQGFYFSKPLPENDFVDYIRAYGNAL